MTANMNASQMRAYRDFINFATLNGHYEVKEAEFKEMHGAVYVAVTVGVPNDEGTIAEFICRDTYLFFIGKRSGIFQYVESGNGDYRQVYRKYYEVKHL